MQNLYADSRIPNENNSFDVVKRNMQSGQFPGIRQTLYQFQMILFQAG